MLVLVQNNNVVSTIPPEDLSDSELEAAGWIPVEDPGPPTIDKATQDLRVSIAITSTKMLVSYEVIDKEVPVSDQLESLRQILVTKGTITSNEANSSKVSAQSSL